MKELKEKIKQIQKDLNVVEKSLIKEVEGELKRLLVKYPIVKSILVGVNNHEFNDGSPTRFYVYWEGSMVTFKNGEVIEDFILADEEDEIFKTPEIKAFQKEFEDFVSIVDSVDFESVWGDKYEEIEIKLNKNNELIIN